MTSLLWLHYFAAFDLNFMFLYLCIVYIFIVNTFGISAHVLCIHRNIWNFSILLWKKITLTSTLVEARTPSNSSVSFLYSRKRVIKSFLVIWDSRSTLSFLLSVILLLTSSSSFDYSYWHGNIKVESHKLVPIWYKPSHNGLIRKK